jgi:hypothetical protein
MVVKVMKRQNLRLRKSARKWANKFDWEKAGKQSLKLIETMV